MKQYIKNSCYALGALLALTACSENSWNDQLKGFEPPMPGEEVETVTYAMTAADYKTLAGLSDNKAIAEAAGESAELEAIGKNATFISEEQAHKYMPAFLANSNFSYFTLDNGSSVKVTYNVAADVNPEVTAINAGVETYSVTERDYKNAWGSNSNFISAFAPAHTPEASLPGFLAAAYPDAKEGAYAVASYNWSAVNPVFSTGGSEPEKPVWKTTNVLGDVAEGKALDINGIVTAICTQGFIVTDNGGSIFIYQGSGFDMGSLAINDLVTVKGTVMVYGQGWQIKEANVTKAGEGDYELPDPVEYTGAMIEEACARTAAASPVYVSVTGKLSINEEKGYYNILVSGTEKCDASCYMLPEKFKKMMTNGESYTITGWFISVSGSSHANIVVTGVSPVGAKAPRRAVRRAESIGEVSNVVALYNFNGTAWAEAKDAIILQAADYTAMGQSHANLTGTDPEKYIPIYLKSRLAYAAEGDKAVVVYAYYASSATTYRASEFQLTEGEWELNAGSVTEQYSKADGKWQYNPSVVVNLPSDKSAFSVEFYQACVDWVYENKCVPLGDTSIKSGKFWVTSYGNNEYWSGTSAYQTNVDIRPTAAKNQYAAGFEGMSDAEIQEFIMTNLCESTFPAVLSKFYPDAEPIPGIHLTYTINFGTYDGARHTESVVYEVTGKGEFTYESCTWFENQ